MRLSISTRINIKIGDLSQAFIIYLIKIQSNKSSSQTYNVKIFPKMPKNIYFGQIV